MYGNLLTITFASIAIIISLGILSQRQSQSTDSGLVVPLFLPAGKGGYNVFKHRKKEESEILQQLQEKPTIAHWLQYGAFLQESKRVKEAETAFQRALRGSNYNGAVAVKLAKFYTASQLYSNADETYRNLTTRWQPKFLSGHINYAHFLYDVMKQPDQAKAVFLSAVNSNPKNASLRNDFAIFLKGKSQDYDEAEKQYKIGLKLKPDCQHLNNNYALFLKNIRQDMSGAARQFQRGIALNPSALLHSNYAIFLETILRDFPLAKKHFSLSLKMDPKSTDTRANHAIFLYESMRDYANAESEFNKALESNPNHAFTLCTYASFLTRVRLDSAKAEQLYLKAIKENPQHAKCHHTYALFLKQSRRGHDASMEHLIHKASSLDPRLEKYWADDLAQRKAWRNAEGSIYKCFSLPVADVAHVLACVIGNLLYA